MLETLSAMYRFMPWISAVTAISVVVARMIPSRVRKLRSLFLRSESTAIRAASQKEALGRNFRDFGKASLSRRQDILRLFLRFGLRMSRLHQSSPKRRCPARIAASDGIRNPR